MVKNTDTDGKVFIPHSQTKNGFFLLLKIDFFFFCTITENNLAKNEKFHAYFPLGLGLFSNAETTKKIPKPGSSNRP